MSTSIIENEIISKEIVNDELNREDVFEKLFNSYNYGNLGMFIGAGFSKAITEDRIQSALSWFELIKSVSEKLELEFPKENELIGVSLPELSTKLCKDLSKRDRISYCESKAIFKNKICEISNWLPSDENIEIFRQIFNTIEPYWIITTNYDLVLEAVLTGKCKSLSPLNYLSAPRGVIPIYHIHGTRLDSDSIIVTQDDYIPLFRPNEYRQSKLAMTIRESTTLVLGYSLGDMNVLSALDWSKNIYTIKNEYPHEIIQAIWTDEPKENPYRDENGNIIIEIDDLKEFLSKLSEYLVQKKEEYNKRINELNELLGLLEVDNEDLVDKFMNEEEFRIDLLKLASEFEYNMIYSYIEFLTRCIARVKQERYSYVDFAKCNKCLNILLDVVINYEYKKISPKLFKRVAEELNEVLYHVELEEPKSYLVANGYSWAATKSWHKRKVNISSETLNQLYNYSIKNSLFRLRDFCEVLLKFNIDNFTSIS